MLIDRINLNQLRVFESVFRTGSMTVASQELHLTQSGVSQHIKSLEEQISAKLFDRLNQKLVPTSAARDLFQKSHSGLLEIEEALSEIMTAKNELRGQINIGMPIEFGNNVILPLLSRFSKDHPAVTYNLKLDFASSINKMLLSGEVDFAFVDEYKMSSPILVDDIYEETFELCVSKKHYSKISEPKNKKEFESLKYVEYQPGAPVLHRWFSTQFPGRRIELDVKVTVMDVQAIARLIRSGMGAGVLPGPIAREIQESDRDFRILKGSGERVTNKIRIARMKEKTLSESAKALISFIESHLKKDTKKYHTRPPTERGNRDFHQNY